MFLSYTLLEPAMRNIQEKLRGLYSQIEKDAVRPESITSEDGVDFVVTTPAYGVVITVHRSDDEYALVKIKPSRSTSQRHLRGTPNRNKSLDFCQYWIQTRDIPEFRGKDSRASAQVVHTHSNFQADIDSRGKIYDSNELVRLYTEQISDK